MPTRPLFALTPENLGDIPSVSFDVRKEFLVRLMKSITLVEVAGHGVQSSTGRRNILTGTHLADALSAQQQLPLDARLHDTRLYSRPREGENGLAAPGAS